MRSSHVDNGKVIALRATLPPLRLISFDDGPSGARARRAHAKGRSQPKK